jgi:hypothetical protein
MMPHWSCNVNDSVKTHPVAPYLKLPGGVSGEGGLPIEDAYVFDNSVEHGRRGGADVFGSFAAVRC